MGSTADPRGSADNPRQAAGCRGKNHGDNMTKTEILERRIKFKEQLIELTKKEIAALKEMLKREK